MDQATQEALERAYQRFLIQLGAGNPDLDLEAELPPFPPWTWDMVDRMTALLETPTEDLPDIIPQAEWEAGNRELGQENAGDYEEVMKGYDATALDQQVGSEQLSQATAVNHGEVRLVYDTTAAVNPQEMNQVYDATVSDLEPFPSHIPDQFTDTMSPNAVEPEELPENDYGTTSEGVDEQWHQALASLLEPDYATAPAVLPYTTPPELAPDFSKGPFATSTTYRPLPARWEDLIGLPPTQRPSKEDYRTLWCLALLSDEWRYIRTSPVTIPDVLFTLVPYFASLAKEPISLAMTFQVRAIYMETEWHGQGGEEKFMRFVEELRRVAGNIAVANGRV